VNDNGGGLLDVAARVPLAWLPERWRPALRAYLEHGEMPPPSVRQLLEGSGVRLDPSMTVPELHELAAVAAWIEAHLPAQCWGSRDQCQLWIVYLRRARGRALLGMFDDEGEATDGNAGTE